LSKGALALALLAAAVAVTACAPADPSPGALSAGVSVELIQLRSDVVDRTAQLRLRNNGDTDLAVTHLALTDARFATPIVREKLSRVPAGRTLDMRIDLPPVACDADGAAASTSLELRYEVDGRDLVAKASVPDSLAFIPLLHEKECLRERLAEVAVLSWGAFEASDAPAPASLSLDIAPSGGEGAARIETIETTNLLMFDAAGAAPFVVGADVSGAGAAREVRVPIVPLRCDPHAVVEDKRGTIFDVTVTVDGVSGVVELAAPAEIKDEILRWVADWCGFGAA
jgi:hypothetical protein